MKYTESKWVQTHCLRLRVVAMSLSNENRKFHLQKALLHGLTNWKWQNYSILLNFFLTGPTSSSNTGSENNKNSPSIWTDRNSPTEQHDRTVEHTGLVSAVIIITYCTTFTLSLSLMQILWQSWKRNYMKKSRINSFLQQYDWWPVGRTGLVSAESSYMYKCFIFSLNLS